MLELHPTGARLAAFPAKASSPDEAGARRSEGDEFSAAFLQVDQDVPGSGSETGTEAKDTDLTLDAGASRGDLAVDEAAPGVEEAPAAAVQGEANASAGLPESGSRDASATWDTVASGVSDREPKPRGVLPEADVSDAGAQIKADGGDNAKALTLGGQDDGDALKASLNSGGQEFRQAGDPPQPLVPERRADRGGEAEGERPVPAYRPKGESITQQSLAHIFAPDTLNAPDMSKTGGRSEPPQPGNGSDPAVPRENTYRVSTDPRAPDPYPFQRSAGPDMPVSQKPPLVFAADGSTPDDRVKAGVPRTAIHVSGFARDHPGTDGPMQKFGAAQIDAPGPSFGSRSEIASMVAPAATSWHSTDTTPAEYRGPTPTVEPHAGQAAAPKGAAPWGSAMPAGLQGEFAGEPSLRPEPAAPTDLRALTDVPRPAPAFAPSHARTADVIQQVTAKIAAAPNAPAERMIEVTLSPVELGRVRLVMTPGDVLMTVAVIADRPETLDMMRRHIDLLAQDFRDMGYEGAEFSFRHDRRNERSLGAERSSGEDGAQVPDPPSPEVATHAIQRIALDTLDLRL